MAFYRKCFFFMKQYEYLCQPKRIIWEFRTLYNKTDYRLFAFLDRDKETLVIATHGIIKKTQKTPSKEIAKAEAIRKEYFKNK